VYVGLTESVKVCVLVPPSASVTVMVTSAVPVPPGAGVSVTVRFAPLPPKVMLPLGSSVGLEEVALSSSDAAAVSASLIVKLIGPLAVLIAVPWLAMEEIVGDCVTANSVGRTLGSALSREP